MQIKKLLSFSSKHFRLFSLVLFTFCVFNANGQDPKAGKALFRTKCGSCHDVSLQQKMTGPALMGVIERWNEIGKYNGKSGEEWLKSWILNWNDPVKAGLPYAVKMKDFDASAMTVFSGQISEEEMGHLMAYIANPAAASPVLAATAGVAGGEKDSKGTYTMAILLALGILLIAVYLLGKTQKGLKAMDVEKGKGDTYSIKMKDKDEKPFYLKSSFKSALMLATIVLFVFALGKSAINLGRQQGYQPTQPIKFSHELHAGVNKIDCKYCHFTAADGKHANIPSVSTCMNCHKAVSEGPKHGKTEIAKIYDAVGWDAATQTYSKTPKPVEWVRIHNLPDHVYFNHAQHVTAGKVECQTCHGPIETMEEVYQYAPLSMGWCINCHRNHDVQFVDNKYYETFKSYHEELKNGDRTRVTVNDIGGTECAKCHY